MEEIARMMQIRGVAKWYEPEHPQHRVRLTKPFYLGVHEVTQEQYERVMKADASKISDIEIKGPRYPVTRVTWDDAIEFCHKLLSLPEEQAAGRTYRLPTEAEWEYACRAGSTTRHSYPDYAGDLTDYEWYERNSSGTIHCVGEKRPNAWGLFDMRGNACEWCEDWYGGDYYAKSPVDDPPGPVTGSDRVRRGGSWVSSAMHCRSAYRKSLQPDGRGLDWGFRVASVPSGSTASGTKSDAP